MYEMMPVGKACVSITWGLVEWRLLSPHNRVHTATKRTRTLPVTLICGGLHGTLRVAYIHCHPLCLTQKKQKRKKDQIRICLYLNRALTTGCLRGTSETSVRFKFCSRRMLHLVKSERELKGEGERSGPIKV